MEIPENLENRVNGGIHNRSGLQFFQNSVDTFNYQVYSTSVPLKPRTLPRQATPLFTGRQDVATKLAVAFSQDHESPPRLQRRFVICGLGGTGKSEICLKFAEDHYDRYWGIFWIDCSNESNAKESFKRIAHICRLPTSELHPVKDFLSSSNEKWLLILDNADNPAMDCSEYLPARNMGDVIITTRNETLVEHYSTVGSHHLDELEPHSAQELLLRAANISQAIWQDKAASASIIVKELGGHTLAILQAASFIKQNCYMEEYLYLYQQQRDRLFMFCRDQELSAYKTVQATFEMSINYLESIRQTGATDAEDALALLNILSFMHFDGAIEEIFTSATTRAIEILQQDTSSHQPTLLDLSEKHAKLLPRFFPKKEGLGSKILWRQACNKLKMFSLIKISGGENDEQSRMSLHPLLHTWIRERQDLSRQTQSWYTALLTLAFACPKERKMYSYKHEILQSHIRACMMNRKAEYVQNLPPNTIQAILMAILYAQFHLCEDYGTDQLLSLIESYFGTSNVSNRQFQTLEDSKENRGLTPGPESLEILTLHAWYLGNRGDDFSALREFQYIVKVQEATLKRNDPALLSSQRQLADTYRIVGQKRRALAILELHLPAARALEISDRVRTGYLVSLAKVYRSMNRAEEAVSILEEIHDVNSQKLDFGDPYRLKVQVDLANTYNKTAQHEKAIALLENVAKIQKTMSCTSYQDLFNTQLAFANAYRSNGQLKDAILMYEQILEVDSDLTTVLKTSRACALHNLALALFQDCQFRRAIEYVRRAIALDDDSGLDIWHPSRLESRLLLADTYEKTRQNGEAIKVLEDAMELEEREILDTTNQKLLDICGRLIEAYEIGRRTEEAKHLRNRVAISKARAKNSVNSK